MSESNGKEKKEFLLRFCGSSAIQLFKEAFSNIVGRKVDCLFFDSEYAPLETKKRYRKKIPNNLKDIKPALLKEIKVFKGSRNKPCLSIPVTQGYNIYGFVIVLDLRREPDKKELAVMKLFIDLALKDFQKEQELRKLYDTIRPRAIALSTIHTVHRLLTSTLDMRELIERIARLTLQVMRSKYCSIMLLDTSKNYLIPKAVIDLKFNAGSMRKKYRKIKIGAGAICKVARTGKADLSRNSVCVPLVEEDIIGIICARNKTNNTPFTKFDMEILLTLAEQAVIAIRNAQMYEEQKKMAYGSIKSLAALLDAKSPHTYTHSEQFVKIVMALAEEMRLSMEETTNLRYAALLPDTGKFSIPDEILKKRGGLSRKEFSIIKRQHLESLKILKPLEFLKPAMPTIMYHHERYDGTGYPEGLKGKDIPIGARIMAVADAFEAMLSRKKNMTQAIKELDKNKGAQFDPDVVKAFVLLSKKPEFKEIFL